LAEVLAENIMKLGMYSEGIPFSNFSASTTVLPVPVGPTVKTYITKKKTQLQSDRNSK